VKPDDPSIEDAEALYWRAPELPLDNWTLFDEGRNSHRVRGGAFPWNEDGVSCYIESILTDIGLNHLAVKEVPRNGILSVQAGKVRECKLGAARDPDPDDIPRDQLKPRDSAHALIVHGDDVGRKQRNRLTSALAATAQIVHWGEGSSESAPRAEPGPGQ
jgi:hypothetical protein